MWAPKDAPLGRLQLHLKLLDLAATKRLLLDAPFQPVYLKEPANIDKPKPGNTN
jgi:hypothetical protein